MTLLADQIAEQQKQLKTAGDASAEDLYSTWKSATKRVQSQIDALEVELSKGDLSASKVFQLNRYHELIAEYNRQMDSLMKGGGSVGQKILQEGVYKTTGLGYAHAQELAKKQGLTIPAEFVGTNDRAVQASIAASRTPVMQQTFARYGTDGAEIIKNSIADGIARGENSKQIATRLKSGLDGDMPKARIQAMVRTETARAYRAAQAEMYQSMASALDGVMWSADKSARTCPACLAMDGKVFPVDKPPTHFHIACRCTLTPVPKGATNDDYETGTEWLGKQPEDTQVKILGKQKQKLYSSGQLGLSDFVGIRHDPKWGDSVQVLSISQAMTTKVDLATTLNYVDSLPDTEATQLAVVEAAKPQPVNPAIRYDTIDEMLQHELEAFYLYVRRMNKTINFPKSGVDKIGTMVVDTSLPAFDRLDAAVAIYKKYGFNDDVLPIYSEYKKNGKDAQPLLDKWASKPGDTSYSYLEMQDKQWELARNFRDQANSAQRDAVERYIGPEYVDINAGLRAGNIPDHLKQTVADIDSAFTAELDANGVLYRGMTMTPAALKHFPLTPGSVWREDGYFSSSDTLRNALSFAKGTQDQRILIKMNVQKGQKVVALHEVGKNYSETLLPRGTMMKVLGTSTGTDSYGGYTVVEVDVDMGAGSPASMAPESFYKTLNDKIKSGELTWSRGKRLAADVEAGKIAWQDAFKPLIPLSPSATPGQAATATVAPSPSSTLPPQGSTSGNAGAVSLSGAGTVLAPAFSSVTGKPYTKSFFHTSGDLIEYLYDLGGAGVISDSTMKGLTTLVSKNKKGYATPAQIKDFLITTGGVKEHYLTLPATDVTAQVVSGQSVTHTAIDQAVADGKITKKQGDIIKAAGAKGKSEADVLTQLQKNIDGNQKIKDNAAAKKAAKQAAAALVSDPFVISLDGNGIPEIPLSDPVGTATKVDTDKQKATLLLNDAMYHGLVDPNDFYTEVYLEYLNNGDFEQAILELNDAYIGSNKTPPQIDVVNGSNSTAPPMATVPTGYSIKDAIELAYEANGDVVKKAYDPLPAEVTVTSALEKVKLATNKAYFDGVLATPADVDAPLILVYSKKDLPGAVKYISDAYTKAGLPDATKYISVNLSATDPVIGPPLPTIPVAVLVNPPFEPVKFDNGYPITPTTDPIPTGKITAADLAEKGDLYLNKALFDGVFPPQHPSIDVILDNLAAGDVDAASDMITVAYMASGKPIPTIDVAAPTPATPSSSTPTPFYIHTDSSGHFVIPSSDPIPAAFGKGKAPNEETKSAMLINKALYDKVLTSDGAFNNLKQKLASGDYSGVQKSLDFLYFSVSKTLPDVTIDTSIPLAPPPLGLGKPAAPPSNSAIPFVTSAVFSDLSELTYKGPKPGGSAAGALYTDINGETWLIKAYNTPGQAHSEKLAAELYRLAGLEVPDLQVLDVGKKWPGKATTGIASKWLYEPIFDIGKASKGEISMATSGFAVDAWLSNWDVVGADSENLVVGELTGQIYRVDVGGSLNYKAMGDTKGSLFGTSVTEWDSLRNPKYKQNNAVYGGMSTDDLMRSSRRVTGISDSDIRDTVMKYGPGTDAEKMALADKLIARKNDIADRVNKAAQSTVVPNIAPAQGSSGPAVAPKYQTNVMFEPNGFISIPLTDPIPVSGITVGTEEGKLYLLLNKALYDGIFNADPTVLGGTTPFDVYSAIVSGGHGVESMLKFVYKKLLTPFPIVDVNPVSTTSPSPSALPSPPVQTHGAGPIGPLTIPVPRPSSHTGVYTKAELDDIYSNYHNREVITRLSTAEEAGWKYYKGNGYVNMNGKLRANTSSEMIPRDSSIRAKVKAMDASLARREFVFNGVATAYRGMKFEKGQGLLPEFNDFRPGTIFKDRGYLSSSLERTTAENFAGSGSGGISVVLTIKIPEGKGYIPIDALGYTEREVAFGRDTQFIVQKTRKVVKPNGKLTYEVDVVVALSDYDRRAIDGDREWTDYEVEGEIATALSNNSITKSVSADLLSKMEVSEPLAVYNELQNYLSGKTPMTLTAPASGLPMASLPNVLAVKNSPKSPVDSTKASSWQWDNVNNVAMKQGLDLVNSVINPPAGMITAWGFTGNPSANQQTVGYSYKQLIVPAPDIITYGNPDPSLVQTYAVKAVGITMFNGPVWGTEGTQKELHKSLMEDGSLQDLWAAILSTTSSSPMADKIKKGTLKGGVMTKAGKPDQILASAFTQYIYAKQGASDVYQTSMPDEYYGVGKWQDSEFGPIEAAFDQLFAATGMKL